MKRTLINKTSASLQQLIDERLKMTVEEQQSNRINHWLEIQERIKTLDAKWAAENITLSEDEIAVMVSKNRREEYEASLLY